MDNIQTELKAAQGAMEDNILKITQRGETLRHLQERTGTSPSATLVLTARLIGR
jgi:hypothetical protein